MGQRYLTLDAMRGVAAIVVVIYHSAIITSAGCTQATCNAPFGYLAVDMFFALSGFVLSHRYDAAFAGGMSAWGFARGRIVRLLPIYWLALLVGLPLAAIDLMKGDLSVATLLGATTFNAAILPWNGGAAHPYAVALLRPAWSLFFELWVANLVFALFWRQLRGANLAVLIALSFAGLVVGTCWYGTLDMGPVWATFPGGFARVLFSFFAGVALRRAAGRIAMPALPGLPVVALTVVTFFVPAPAGWQHVVELSCVALVYPALILAGASATERRPRLATWLGDASYALYLVHMPLLDYWTKAMHRLSIAPRPAAAAAFVVVAIAAALAIDRFYDRRARRRLAAFLDRPSRGRVAPAAALVPAGAGAPLG